MYDPETNHLVLINKHYKKHAIFYTNQIGFTYVSMTPGAAKSVKLGISGP